MMKKYIRIVAGQYRKTRIEVPEATGLRPTPDRVRETLFNWLTYFWQSDFADKRVLDLFAGSGALGFEAASRGVAHVQMVESNPTAVSALRKLRDKLGTELVRIHIGDARKAISRLTQTQFDLVFLDPPFGQGWFPSLLTQIYPLLAAQGLVYVESETVIAAPQGYIALRQSRAGAVHYQLFQRVALQEP
jgi:16S rRNA (guanine966-N2)-methyltransferase